MSKRKFTFFALKLKIFFLYKRLEYFKRTTRPFKTLSLGISIKVKRMFGVKGLSWGSNKLAKYLLKRNLKELKLCSLIKISYLRDNSTI